MKKVNSIFAAFLIFSLTLSLAGCSKKSKDNQESEAEVPQRAVKLSRIDEETKSYLEGKHICVVLGYGYNDETFVSQMKSQLDLNYGIKSEDAEGLILLYVYPDDFDFAGRTRISKLFDMVKDESLAGIVLLGAPEGMNIPLAKLQDNTEGGTLPYPIFTLFPQDEVLASEATADFVLDYAQKTDSLDALEADLVPDFDASAILSSSIQSMLSLRGPVNADKNLQAFVQKLVGPRRAINHYVDSETGLQAANHFIFE